MTGTALHSTKHSRAPSWQFRLYIAGKTQKSLRAFENLESFCKNHFPGKYRIEVVDVAGQPGVAQRDNILAVPTVLKRAPSPEKRLIGDCSDTAQMLAALEI